MISETDVETYRKRGYLVVPNVLSEQEVADLRRVTEEFVEGSRAISAHTDVYDLEPGHTKEAPKVRRIKPPHLQHPVYDRMVRHPRIIAVLKALWGPNVRFEISKLNLKSAGFGSPVEWHQDWAYYPHTNDDLAAVGIMIDDFTPDNGPMQVIPGSHKGPIYDHHTKGHFIGGIDPSKSNIDFSKAVQCLGKAGSITVHHVRLLHASSANISGAPRRFLLHQYRAADAWPLIYPPTDWGTWESLLISGEETPEPRMVQVPIRLPFPPPPNQGSIYENQRDLETKFFKTADELAGTLTRPQALGRESSMISETDVETYRKRGYLVVPNVLSEQEVADLRRVTEEFVEGSRAISAHTDVYDLEPGHTKEAPKVRRIKPPHLQHPVYDRMVRHPRIIAVLKALWGPNVRFEISKLNLKSAGFGSPVEWHQDWAYYPHTNDDLAAVGIMIDDFTPDNGPMQVIPGSHKGPIYDHHTKGHFIGGIDPSKSNIDFSKAVQCLGKAGSITVHHVRLLHASSANISGAPRRFLLHQYRAADAWPLIYPPTDWGTWESLLISGEETPEPRMVQVPIRLPFPPPPNQGSIYENQRDLETKFFKTADELAGKKLEPAQ